MPITSHAAWVLALQGITLPDVLVQGRSMSPAMRRQETVCLASRRGALLFAHFGVSGPAVMDVSHAVSGHAAARARSCCGAICCRTLPKKNWMRCWPASMRAAGKRRVAALLDRWLPHRVGETLIVLAGTPPDRPAAEFSKADRRRLVQTVKRLDIPVAGTMGFRKAEVTAGGVALDEVDSRTMQSRIVPNLYFAGELLDLNGPVGGYNFQAAFSTGWLAGESV